MLAVLTPIVGNRVNQSPQQNPSPVRWVGLVGSGIIACLGLSFSLMGIFSPQVYRLSAPASSIAASAYLLGVIPACILLFVVSNLNSPSQPNLMRWLALVMTYSWLSYPTVLSLLLIYAFPGQLSPEVLVHASLLALGYIPPALVVVGLARNYISVPTARPDPGLQRVS